MRCHPFRKSVTVYGYTRARRPRYRTLHHVLENGREKAWSEQERQVAVEQNNAMAERSLRVLALAERR